MNNKLQQLNNKKIAILGLGIENYVLLEFLLKNKVNSVFDIYDLRDSLELGKRFDVFKDNKNINLFKQSEENDFSEYDLIFRSPGFPLFTENLIVARDKGIEISSAMKLFFKLCPSKNIIGVTGSKGKGTTASLIQTILEQANIKSFLGGNIGIAPFSFIEEIKEFDWVVLELSSFQLEDMQVSPHISVITNLSEEHLKPADPLNPNYHQTEDGYTRAKLNILKYHQKEDFAILNENFKDKPLFFNRAKGNNLGKAKRVYFGKSEFTSKLIGNYNKENVAAAVSVAKILDIKIAIAKQAILNFKGLEHRIEFSREVRGVKYYDNSFATTPEATMADLDSFVEPIILFLGGADKGSSFEALSKDIVKNKVKFIVLLAGDASNKINQELLASGFPSHKIAKVDSMPGAVKIASDEAIAGDVVLLSTACASFGMFKNYKERGCKFQEEVEKL